MPGITDYIDLLYAANKYDLPGMTTCCYGILKNINVDMDNFWCFLKIFSMFGPEIMDPENILDISFFLDHNAECLLNSSEFEELEQSMVLKIIQRGTLLISETTVFSSLLAWARAECCRQRIPVITPNMRAVMGEILHFVRLFTIPALQLTVGPLASEIFTDDERHMFRLGLADKLQAMPAPWKHDVLRAKRHGDRQARWKFVHIDPNEVLLYFRRETLVFFFLRDLVLTELTFHMHSDGGQVNVLAEILNYDFQVKAKCVFRAKNVPEQTEGAFTCPVFFKAFSWYTLTLHCSKGYVVRRGNVHPRAMFKGEPIFFIYTLIQGCDERKVSISAQQVRQLQKQAVIGNPMESLPHLKLLFETNIQSVISSVTADICL